MTAEQTAAEVLAALVSRFREESDKASVRELHDSNAYARRVVWDRAGELLTQALAAAGVLTTGADEGLRAVLAVVDEWHANYGPESKWERSAGPQVVSVVHIHEAIHAAAEGRDPEFLTAAKASFPECEGSLLALAARLAAVEEVADDGGDYAHVTDEYDVVRHQPGDDPYCPACWQHNLRTALAATPQPGGEA